MERWITLSTGKMTIQWIVWFVLSTLIYWIEIYPGRVVQKPVNADPGLKVNQSINFSCIKMFFTSYVLCSLTLPKLKTERTDSICRKPYYFGCTPATSLACCRLGGALLAFTYTRVGTHLVGSSILCRVCRLPPLLYYLLLLGCVAATLVALLVFARVCRCHPCCVTHYH